MLDVLAAAEAKHRNTKVITDFLEVMPVTSVAQQYAALENLRGSFPHYCAATAMRLARRMQQHLAGYTHPDIETVRQQWADFEEFVYTSSPCRKCVLMVDHSNR